MPSPSSTVWERREGKLTTRATATVTKVDRAVEATLSVTFTDVDAIRGQPVTHILCQITKLVSRTVTLLESEMKIWLEANPP